MGEAEDIAAAAADELRSRLVYGGALDDSIASIRKMVGLAEPQPDEPNAAVVLELVRAGVLIPVQVFGADSCCQHGENAVDVADCDSTGFGLMDKFGLHSVGSDCNRAEEWILRPSDAVMDALRDLGVNGWPDDHMGAECAPGWPLPSTEENR